MNAAAQLYEDRHLTVRDGLKLHYRDYPGDTSKPPILCLAGLTRNSRDFADFAERYSPRFRVLALDFRGRGMSDYDPMPARYLPPTYAYDVIELLDQLAIPEAIFVGTSLGGLVTMAVAALAPQRIAAAILNDVGPELSDAGLDRIKSYVGKGVQFKDWDEVARAIASNNSHAFESYTADDWIRMAKRNMREDNGEIVFDYDMAIAEPFKAAGPAPEIDMWPLFAALARKPLLVIRGANSDLLSAEALDKMRSAAAAMKSVVVPGVGHAPDLSEPEAVAAIDEFLGAIEAAA
ncbi:MAG: alpha/beta fold hydrolase [Sphingomicrobium sp.]